MPFVNKEHRENPDVTIPGDRCYVYYRMMIDDWKKSPRWTTIDFLLKRIVDNDDTRAYILAFAVFFVKHGMEYEKEKERENGPIE